ncbi:MAG: caspase family protein [Candidatus Marinimicrobia bacterium]|jgi:hypothetical protein|nr:caspase family protein [Candidatus Neomarinimicrobiota bacterium]
MENYIINLKLLYLFIIFTIGFSITGENIYDNSWALIIGIDKYHNVQKLNYAVDDAESIKDILRDSYNFPSKNISILINEEATKPNILKSFSEITKNAKENDRVLVFFAGHGETMDLPGGGEKGYLIPVEGDAEELYLTSIPMDELREIALMSEAKHMLYLVDACYGGIAAVGSRGLEPQQTPDYINKVTKFQSRQVITAGGRGEKVIEKPEWGHSAFTLNLLRGLKDGAADYNADGFITANELGMYLSDKVSTDSENQQTPQYGRMTSQEGEFIFVYSENTIINQDISSVSSDEKLDLLIAKIDKLESQNKNVEVVDEDEEEYYDDESDFSITYDEEDYDDDKDDKDIGWKTNSEVWFYVQYIKSNTYNKILPNFNRVSIGGAYNFYKKMYVNVAYSHYYDKDVNKSWLKIDPQYFEAQGIQFGLTIPIINHNLETQVSYSLCNSQYDIDGEFEDDFGDRKLGHNIAINLLGTWAEDDDSSFRFLLNFGYDINDLINESNEKLLNGLAIGFGFQFVSVDY